MRRIILVSIIAFSCLNCIYSFAQTNVVNRYDLVIDEILADPDPVVGLPNAEFVELKNRSGKPVDLQGFRLTSSTTRSGLFPSIILPADSFLIITSNTNATLFSTFGRVVGITSFPALNNTGTTLSILSKEGLTIHSVSYNTSWYRSDVKSNGGWSVEMIDTDNPCTGESNWRSSTDVKGGTPGSTNSVRARNPDEQSPALIRAAAIDSVTVLLTFNEIIDSLTGATISNYNISDGISAPVSAVTLAPAFTQVQLTLQRPLVDNKVYTVTAERVGDCSGNTIQAAKSARLGLTASADSFDLIINEILFNPKPGGVDYLELFNRSNKIIDLKQIYITNRSGAANTLGTPRQLTTESIPIFPKDYYVISENGSIVKQSYSVKNPGNFIDVQMPSLPDNAGTAVILNQQQKIIDELHYDSKWHFALIDNEQGISLERIDYNKPTQSRDNWTSAASTAGFGTPSYQNSQLFANAPGKASITITPKTFSPDNDGFNDFATINYQMSEPGFVANITIFDAAGRTIRLLTKNATLALSGTYTWDGLDDKFKKVPVGTYVIYTEVFNLKGTKSAFKNVVVVAARF